MNALSRACAAILIGALLPLEADGFSIQPSVSSFGLFRAAQLDRSAYLFHKWSHPKTKLFMTDEDDDEDDDDDEDEPLSRGIDSVSWLPTLIGATGSVPEMDESPEGAEVLPLFPLGGIVYTPNSEHILNIFEPRYREMYSDILMNGSKKFVVSMSHPTESGRFAQMGVLFELEDLKEVSEQTADRIKYICNHKVTGRVKLHRVLNPEAWQSRDTYLRVEGTITDDSGKSDKDEKDGDEKSASSDVYGQLADAASSEGNPKEEKALRDAFADLVDMQHELEEDVRFTRASVATLAVKPGAGEDGLWQTIRLWQSFVDQRLMARQNELQSDFQEKLQEYLKKEKGMKEGELPSTVGFSDLSKELQQEVQELQKRMGVELKPLVLESTLTMQKILEAPDHKARLNLVRHFVEAETKRLTTKKALKGMFSSSGSDMSVLDSADIPPEERVSSSDSFKMPKSPPSDSNDSSSTSSLFTDEPDAFQ